MDKRPLVKAAAAQLRTTAGTSTAAPAVATAMHRVRDDQVVNVVVLGLGLARLVDSPQPIVLHVVHVLPVAAVTVHPHTTNQSL